MIDNSGRPTCFEVNSNTGNSCVSKLYKELQSGTPQDGTVDVYYTMLLRSISYITYQSIGLGRRRSYAGEHYVCDRFGAYGRRKG